jgi:chorismate--pyruvate lyase
MNQCFLSAEDIRDLHRDLRILIATDGTLTRMLSIVANDDIALQIIDQKPIAPSAPESKQLPSGRILQRDILLRGQTSGIPYVAAESLLAIDLLPSSMVTALTKTDRTLGEVMVASGLETFKEAATVWRGALPGWVATTGYQDSRSDTLSRRYRVIIGGQPAIIITEHFLQNVFSDDSHEQDHHKYSTFSIQGARNSFAPNDRHPTRPC